MNNINKLCEDAHENAIVHGFYEDWDIPLMLVDKPNLMLEAENALISKRLLLVVGEVSEAMEALRKDDRKNFKEELADVCIRIFDLAGCLDVDLEAEITRKMKKNKLRPYKHGKQF